MFGFHTPVQKTRAGRSEPRFYLKPLVWTHLLLEPAHGLLFADAVLEADPALFPLLVGDAETGSAQNLDGRENGLRAESIWTRQAVSETFGSFRMKTRKHWKKFIKLI